LFVKPNTHRRRDETVESRGVGGVYTNSQLVGDSFVVSSVWTHPSAVVTHTSALCVRIAESVGSRLEFMYTPPTRRDSTVSSRRRRRCVLGLKTQHSIVKNPKYVNVIRHTLLTLQYYSIAAVSNEPAVSYDIPLLNVPTTASVPVSSRPAQCTSALNTIHTGQKTYKYHLYCRRNTISIVNNSTKSERDF